MRKYLVLAIFCVFGLIQISCKKEVHQTPADQITKQLQKIINDRGVDRVFAFDLRTGFQTPLSASTGAGWTFSNDFISIEGYGLNQSRNLNFLMRYDVSTVPLDDGRSVLALLLFFQ